jgi:hypothetical protein
MDMSQQRSIREMKYFNPKFVNRQMKWERKLLKVIKLELHFVAVDSQHSCAKSTDAGEHQSSSRDNATFRQLCIQTLQRIDGAVPLSQNGPRPEHSAKSWLTELPMSLVGK